MSLRKLAEEEAGHAAEGETAGARTWDPWGGWILKWLWECVLILTVNVPGEIFTEFLKTTMEFLTNHELS